MHCRWAVKLLRKTPSRMKSVLTGPLRTGNSCLNKQIKTFSFLLSNELPGHIVYLKVPISLSNKEEEGRHMKDYPWNAYEYVRTSCHWVKSRKELILLVGLLALTYLCQELWCTAERIPYPFSNHQRCLFKQIFFSWPVDLFLFDHAAKL